MTEAPGPDSSDQRPPSSKKTFKSFADLSRGLRETGEDLERLVYPHLEFGAVFWMPNDEMGFGTQVGGQHPWVIIVPYEKGQPTIIACPMTSTGRARRG